MRAGKTVWALPLGALLLCAAGCETLRREPAEPTETSLRQHVFDYDGMPDKKYLVGGGYLIIYRAKEAGELYLADDSSDRLLATISLQPGEEQELVYDVNDPKMVENLEALGIDPKKASFKLYFVPR